MPVQVVSPGSAAPTRPITQPVHPGRPPALVALLCSFLPGNTERDFLLGCVNADSIGARAFQRWISRVRDVESALRDNERGAKSLLPLLARNRSLSELGSDHAPKVRLAGFREELRVRTILRETAGALDVLDSAGCTAAIAGGLPIAATAYPRIDARHCHDVDILVEGEQLDLAVRSLLRHGFTLFEEYGAFRRLVLPNGFNLTIAGNIFRSFPRYAGLESIQLREIEIGGRAVRIPTSGWLVLAKVDHAWSTLRLKPLHTLADLVLLLRRPDLDPGELWSLAQRYALRIQLASLLWRVGGIAGDRWRTNFSFLPSWEGSANPLETELSLQGILPGPAATLGLIARRKHLWPAAAPVVRHFVAPTSASIDRRRHPSLARFYLGRALRFAFRELRRGWMSVRRRIGPDVAARLVH